MGPESCRMGLHSIYDSTCCERASSCQRLLRSLARGCISSHGIDLCNLLISIRSATSI